MAFDWLDEEELPGDNYFPKKEKEIEIPDFLNKGTELPTEEQLMAQAMLNNVPGNGNTQAEEQNHLKQLEEVAINYSGEEWLRVLYHAPFDMMCEEIKRRGQGYEQYRLALLGADEVMKQLKL